MLEKAKKLFEKIRRFPVRGCECCCGEKFMVNPNSRGAYALVTGKGRIAVVNEGTYMVFGVNYCPNCGRKFNHAEEKIQENKVQETT